MFRIGDVYSSSCGSSSSSSSSGDFSSFIMVSVAAVYRSV